MYYESTVARIVDYADVTARMAADGMRSLYFNSGAFGFDADQTVHTRGWIGPPDDSIREAARPFVRQVTPSDEATLAQLATRAWREHFPGDVWVLPMSHWAYELDFGSAEWMPEALGAVGVDFGVLKPRTSGDAIAFASDDAPRFTAFVERLLRRLTSSDFALAFPGRPVRCTVHHHKQLWWQTTNADVITRLDALL